MLYLSCFDGKVNDIDCTFRCVADVRVMIVFLSCCMLGAMGRLCCTHIQLRGLQT
jgi:hypothetical protein